MTTILDALFRLFDAISDRIIDWACRAWAEDEGLAA